MADPRFAQPAAATTPPGASFQAVPGAFEALYGPPSPPKPIFGPPTQEQAAAAQQTPSAPAPKQSMNMRLFGTEDPAKAYLDSAPLPRFVQGVKKEKAKIADSIQKYVEQHPEDADLLNPAPLSSWAKSIGKTLAQVPFRIAAFAGKHLVDQDPLNPVNMARKVIPDSMLHIPTVEDTVMRVAAAAGLPLADAQKTAGEKPGLLKSLHDGFVVPIRNGFEIATMPNGPQKEEAFDAWAYKTAQAFTSGLTVGVVDQAVKDNSVWMDNGELMWRGVPITQLTEMENKGVSAGQLTGQMGGAMVTYALVSPMLTAGLRNVQALDAVYSQHPYLASAILTNASQEGFESVIRKSTGQSYTFNDTLVGMMSGIAFETGKLALGGYRTSIDAEARPDVDVEAVRDFLDSEIRDYTIENGHVPDVNDLRALIGDKTIPGTDMTVNELHTMLANSGLKENRLIELKGGKRGTPGIDYPADLPEPDGGKINIDAEAPDVKVSPQTDLLGEFLGVDGKTVAKDIADIGTDVNKAPLEQTFKTLADKYGKSPDDWIDFVDQKLGDNASTADYNAMEVARIDAEKLSTDVAAKPEPGKLVKVEAEGPDGKPVQIPTKDGYFYRSISPDQLKAIQEGDGTIPVNDQGVVYWAANPDEAKIGSEPYGGQGVLVRAKADDLGNLQYDTKMKGGTSVMSGEVPAGKWDVVEGGDATPPARFAKTGEVEQVFRTDKFNVDEAGQARLKAVQDVLGLNTRDIRSWTDVESAARDIGADPAELMRRVEGKSQLSDVEVEALRQNVQSAHEFLANKYDLIEEAQNRGDMAAVRDIEQKAQINEQIINDSVKKLIGGGTELGRGVAIYRKIAAMKMDDPTYFYKEAMKLIDDGRNKVRFGNQTVDVEEGKLPPELRTAIDSLMESNDQVGLSYLMSQLKATSNWDKAVHLWKAGLLTAPTTDLANILGNTTMMALETVKDVPATMADVLLSKGAEISNKLFGTSFDESRVKTMTTRTIGAQAEGIFEGAGKAKEYFMTGVDPDDLMAKYDVRGNVNYNNAALQMYTDAVFRKLGAEDLVYRYGFINQSLMESAELAVKNMDDVEIEAAMRGLPEGEPRTEAALVKQMYLNPSDAATKRAIDAAEYGTFQRNNPISSAISGAKNSTSPAGRAALEFIAPFTKTPTNIGMTIFDYTPAGFVTELAKQLKNGPDKLRIVNSLGRGTVGTAVMALGAALNKQGLMTGNAPSSEAERKLWEADRKQPNSIFIGGKWRKLDRVSPIGNLLTIGAEFNELGKTKTKLEQWTQIGFEGVKSVTEQSFLLGVSNALKAVTEPDRFAPTFAENAIRGIVPNIIARVAQGTDKYARETGTLNPVAVLQERIPILREMLPEKLDVLGRKIKMQGGFFGAMFDPFSSKKPSSDPVVQELTRLGQPISAPNRALYSDEEYQQLVELRGKVLMPVLGAAMEDSGYKALPDEAKKQVIEQLDSTITREMHDQLRMATAARIRDELNGMSESDRAKKMEEIKQKNNTVYTLILLLNAAGDNN